MKAILHRSMALLSMLLLLGACSAGGQGGGPGGKDGPGGPQAPLITPDQRVLVEVSPVEPGSVADHLETTGLLESEAQADLTPEASGTVTQVLVEEGDSVQPGQLLAVIENPSLDAGADRATIELEKARTALAEAERLHGSGAISNTELRTAQDALRIAEASHTEARRSRGFTRLTSPIAGTVSLKNVRVGEVAAPGQPALQVVDLDRLRVIVQLPEKDLPRIKEGLPVKLTAAYDETATATGSVQRVSPVVDPGTGTVRVTIAVDPEQMALRPGQFVKVRVEVDRHENVLTIPRRGLVWEDGEPIAWTVEDAPPPEPDKEGEEGDEKKHEGGFLAGIFGGDEKKEGEGEEDKDPWEGIPRRQAIKNRLVIGYVDTERVEVQEGLELGDPVVVLGNNNLRAETLVRLPGDPDPKKDEEEDPGKKADAGAPASGSEG